MNIVVDAWRFSARTGLVRALENSRRPATGILRDRADDVRDSGERLASFGLGGIHRGLGRNGDVRDDGVVDGRHQSITIGEALVEVPRRDTGLLAHSADRQFGLGGAHEFQTGLDQRLSSLGYAERAVDATVRTRLVIHEDHLCIPRLLDISAFRRFTHLRTCVRRYRLEGVLP